MLAQWTSSFQLGVRELTLTMAEKRALCEQLVNWWISIQPDWRKMGGNTLARLSISPPTAEAEAWAQLNHPGEQGIFLVVFSIFLMLRLVDKDALRPGQSIFLLVNDVNWVILHLNDLPL